MVGVNPLGETVWQCCADPPVRKRRIRIGPWRDEAVRLWDQFEGLDGDAGAYQRAALGRFDGNRNFIEML